MVPKRFFFAVSLPFTFLPARHVAPFLGAVLIGALFSACALSRRRNNLAKPTPASVSDLESGHMDRGYVEGSAGNKSPSPNSSYDRSFDGTRDISAKGGLLLASSHPYSEAPSSTVKELARGRNMSPVRSLARGENQRARSISRQGSHVDSEGGPRMYSTTPKMGEESGEGRGQRPFSTTPGRYRTPGRHGTPGKHTTPRRHNTPRRHSTPGNHTTPRGRRSSSGGRHSTSGGKHGTAGVYEVSRNRSDSTERKIYPSVSNTRPVLPSKSWDEPSRRRVSSPSTSPRMNWPNSPGNSGSGQYRRGDGGAEGGGRRSRQRALRSFDDYNDRIVSEGARVSAYPPSLGESSSGGGGSGGGGNVYPFRSESRTGHVLGFRRSVSVGRGDTGGRRSGEPEEWEEEISGRWEERRTRVPKESRGTGRRRDRLPHRERRSKSVGSYVGKNYRIDMVR